MCTANISPFGLVLYHKTIYFHESESTTAKVDCFFKPPAFLLFQVF